MRPRPERWLEAYMHRQSWFERHDAGRRLRLAYFCAGFGLHVCLP